MLRDRFELEYEIGSGGMGTVFKGVDSQSGQSVAIKRLKPELINPAMLERFRREGEALLQLNHPNIVDFIDAFEDDGQHYLVLEYIDGNDLQDAILQDRPDVPRIVDIALGVADALTRAHFLNILHRDIKPSNILISHDGGVFLTDFGAAALGELSHLTEPDGVIGTIPYLSPEVLEGCPVSTNSDIWAFGIVLYEMLTGERPFQGDHAGTLMRAILFDDVPDLESVQGDIPVPLQDLIYRMLEKDPMFRIPSVRLVGVELEALKKGYVPYSPRQLKHALAPELKKSRFETPSQVRRELNNLPSPLTSFVGRDPELLELERLLCNERLISIVAPGGMGKTRLALEAANRQLGKWTHGVFFVDLAPVSLPEIIPNRIAEAINFQLFQEDTPRKQVMSYLREKQLLLVLDNFEHLLAGVDIVSDILQTAPDVAIICTSRERLHLQGETLFTISGMDFPEWETPKHALEFSAVKLFMQGARRADPTFELIEEDLRFISRICRLVDGMPLGILLAASWVSLLTPEEIATEITQDLDFLETEQHDVPARQRSIRAILDYSWKHLGQHQQDVCAALSVFRGGFTRDAAQHVAGAGLRHLMSLVNRGIISRHPDGRYSIHELMRQYTGQQLSQNPHLERSAFEKHSLYYLNFLAERVQPLKSSAQFRALHDIEPEVSNIVQAWHHGVDHQFYEALKSALDALLLCMVYRSSIHELHGLLAYAINKVEGPLLARILSSANRYVNDPELVATYANQALAILDTQNMTEEDCVVILGNAGITHHDETLLQRSEDVARASGQPWLEYVARRNWIQYEISNGDFESALQFVHEIIAYLEEAGNQIRLLDAYLVAGILEDSIGNVDGAIKSFRRVITMAREVQQDEPLGDALNNLAGLLAQRGQMDEAIEAIQEAIAIHRDAGRHWYTFAATDTYGYILYSAGKFVQARAVFDECFSIIHNKLPKSLPSKAFTSNRLGFVESRLGNFEAAHKHFVNALKYFPGISERYNSDRQNTLIGLAMLMREIDLPLRALTTLYVVNRYPLAETMDNYVDEARDLTAKLEAELSPEEIETARQQAEAYDLDSFIEELLAEFGE